MTLHESMIKLLKEKKRPMTALEIADELNKNRWYVKGNNSKINQSQITARARKYETIFEIDKSVSPQQIKLLEQKTSSNISKSIIISHSKKSFAPLVWGNTEILILGTMPGDLSLKMGEYYAHPRNRFWKIIATITKNEMPTNYEEKKNLLKHSKIGLWDVAKAADRKGSLDLNIYNAVPNDLNDFLKTYKNIRLIGFNGNKAMTLFAKNFQRQTNHKHVELSSTSPANATINFDQICKDWKRIFSN